ncbi:MAG: hypothetical protein IAF94_08645 [Pirellulaceae bacterium]|nr:hypothetical protein [Pirellulaceae bacterium]
MELTQMNADTISRLAKLEKAATPAPWEFDQHNQRDVETVYCAVTGPEGKSLFDTCNSEAALIHNDSDEDGSHYWDETGTANLQFVAEMRNHAAALLEIARLAGYASEGQRNIIVDLAKQNEKLRKIAAHVPAGIYIQAKEQAGFAEAIVAKS